jgi:hypothetical protein
VVVSPGGKCLHVGNLSQGTFSYAIIDCPSGGTTFGPTDMPAGTFYGDSSGPLNVADSEARNNKPAQWEGK